MRRSIGFTGEASWRLSEVPVEFGLECIEMRARGGAEYFASSELEECVEFLIIEDQTWSVCINVWKIHLL